MPSRATAHGSWKSMGASLTRRPLRQRGAAAKRRRSHASSRSAGVLAREARVGGKRGFTLLEAVVGMALASVVGAIGVVQLVELLGSARLAGAARTTAGTL